MSQKSLISELSRRERQIMDVVYKRGFAYATDMVSELPDKPSYSTVRKLMKILPNGRPLCRDDRYGFFQLGLWV